MTTTKRKATDDAPPAGDKEKGLNPPIPLYDPKLHDEEDDVDAGDILKSDYVEIKVLIDPTKAATKDNLTSKRFKTIKNLVGMGNEVVTVYRQMCIDYFEPEGKMRIADAQHRLLSFLRVLSGDARTEYNQALSEARDEYTSKVRIAYPSDASKLKSLTIREFFKFMLGHCLLHTDEDEVDFKHADGTWFTQSEVKAKIGTNKYLKETAKCIRDFERNVWFLLGETLWSPRHRNAWMEQREYIGSKICKPFKWSMRDYINRVEVLADLLKYIQPPSHIGDEFKDADWKAREDGMNTSQIRKAILHGLPSELEMKALAKCQDQDIRDVKRARFIDTLLEVEIEDEKARETKSRNKKRQKTKKETETKSGPKDWSSRAKGNARKSNLYCGYCKKIGKPEWAYKGTHNEADCNIKKRAEGERSTNLGGNSTSKNKEMKKMQKEFKKVRKMYKSDKKKNKMLLKMVKKNFKKKDFNKFKKKMSFSDSDDSDSDSDSDESSCSSMSSGSDSN